MGQDKIRLADLNAEVTSAISGADKTVWGYDLEQPKVDTNGGQYEEQELVNGFKESENINSSDWTKSGATVGISTGVFSPLIDHDTQLPVEYQSFIPNNTTGVFILFQEVTTSGNTHAVETLFRPFGETWVYFLNNTTGASAYIDLGNKIVGTVVGAVDVSFIDYDNGDVLVRVSFPTTAAVNQLRWIPAVTNGDVTVTGDGATPAFYATGLQEYEGTLEDDRPYVKTTTAAYPATKVFRLVTKKEMDQRESLGLQYRMVSGVKSDIEESPNPAYKYYNVHPVWDADIPNPNPSSFDDQFDLDAFDAKWTVTDANGYSTITHPGYGARVALDQQVATGFANSIHVTIAGVPDYSKPWSMVAKVSIGCTVENGQQGNNAFVGVGLFDTLAATPAFTGCSILMSATTTVGSLSGLYAITTGTGVLVGNSLALAGSIPVYLRVDKLDVDVYTNPNPYLYSISFDGIQWFAIENYTSTYLNNPTKFGFLLQGPNGAGEAGNVVLHGYKFIENGLGDNPLPGKLIYK